MIYRLIIAAVLLFHFFISFFLFQSNHSYQYHSDYNRDYLVAHRMVQDKEIPFVGPGNMFGIGRSSPFYYYFLAGALAVYDDIVFLGLVNVFLQVFSVGLIAALGSTLFDRKVGITVAVLFGLGDRVFLQSSIVFQPYVMQPFLLASFLLLVLSYQKKRFSFMMGSIVLFIFSITLHSSALSIVPVYCFAIFFIVRKMWPQASYLITTAGTFFAGTLFFFAPAVWYAKTNPSSPGNGFLADFFGGSFVVSSLVALQQFIPRAERFLHTAFPRSEEFSDFNFFLFVITILVLMSVYFLFALAEKRRKYIISVLLIGVFHVLIAGSFLDVSPHIPFPERYFEPGYSLTMLIIAEIVISLFSKTRGLLVGQIVLMSFFFFLVTPLLVERVNHVRYLVAQGVVSLRIEYRPSLAAEALWHEIPRIQHEEKKTAFDFFQFRAYRDGTEDLWANDLFWVPLEQQLKLKLTQVQDAALRGYEPITKDDYIFLWCSGYDDAETEKQNCIAPFFHDYINYRLVKNISPHLFVTKKVQQPLMDERNP